MTTEQREALGALILDDTKDSKDGSAQDTSAAQADDEQEQAGSAGDDTSDGEREAGGANDSENGQDSSAVDDSAQSSEAGEGEADAGDALEPKTLKEFAEANELEPDELYELEAGITIDGESEAVTIGELKDYYQQHKGQLKTEAEITQSQIDARQERQQALNNLQAIEQALPPQMQTPEFRAAIAQYNQNQQRIENAKLADVLPEWRNDATFESDSKHINNLLDQYGISPRELNGIIDHRWIVVLRDAALQRHQMTEASQAAKRKVKTAAQQKAGGKANKAKQAAAKAASAKASAARSGNAQAQRDELGALILNN